MAKQPVIELVRQNPSELKHSVIKPKSNTAKPIRVSNRLKTNVKRYNYSKLCLSILPIFLLKRGGVIYCYID